MTELDDFIDAQRQSTAMLREEFTKRVFKMMIDSEPIQTVALDFKPVQLECRWHGVQEDCWVIHNTRFCSQCIENLLLDKLYPLKEKKNV